MTGEARSFKEIMDRGFGMIRSDDMEKAVTLYDTWKSVLQRIRSERNPCEGQNLADHSRVTDLRNGVLFVEADHPGWIALLRVHQRFILSCLRNDGRIPAVETIAYRLSSPQGTGEPPSEREARAEAEKRLREEEDALRREGIPAGSAPPVRAEPLPEELAVIFEDLRKSMLTNSAK